jgi:hypothetical protein
MNVPHSPNSPFDNPEKELSRSRAGKFISISLESGTLMRRRITKHQPVFGQKSSGWKTYQT